MRLFKYLVISNDLIDPSTIYMLNPNEKRKTNKDDRKVAVVDVNSIEDYSNSHLVEVLYNKEYKYKDGYYEKQVVDFQDEKTDLSLDLRHLDKIRDEYREHAEEFRLQDAIPMRMFRDEALLPEDDKALNLQRSGNILLSEHISKKLMSQGYIVNNLHRSDKVIDSDSIIILMDKRHGRIIAEDFISFVNESRENKQDIARRYRARSEKSKKPEKLVLYNTKLISKEVLSERTYREYLRLLVFEDSSFSISRTDRLFANMRNYEIMAPSNVIWQGFVPANIDEELKILDFSALYDKYDRLFSISHNEGLQENILKSFDEFVEESRIELINSENYLLKRNNTAISLDEKSREEKYSSYFVYKKCYKKEKRYVRSRIDNGFYLLKPYQDKPAIALMDFRYSNTADKAFKKHNKAYVVIDTETGKEQKQDKTKKFSNIKSMFELVAGKGFRRDDNYCEGYHSGNSHYDNCSYFHRNSYCTKDKSCISTDFNKFIGATWNTVNSSHSTKRIEQNGLFCNDEHDITNKKNCYNYIEKMQPRSRKSEAGIDLIAPNTDGIITTMVRFYNDKIKKTVTTLHQWIKCSSISGKQSKNVRSKIVHVGHIFDNRSEYLERLLRDKVEQLKENERKNKVYRSDYITVGTSYFSNTFECNCSTPRGIECNYCEGVLYINSEQGLKELYDQLTSEDYKMLKKNIH